MIRRTVDVTIAAALLVLTTPIMIVAMALIGATIGTPILFRQRRGGLRGRVFTLYKLRTMSNAIDERGHPLRDADRLTLLGRMIRSLSIDELPQLWNVLKGEMSLVGPRPLAADYLSIYSPLQSRRHEVRPGITGWAQVNGRNDLSWSRKFELDVWYVDHQSLWLDLRILVLTPITLARVGQVSHSKHATMAPFTGDGTGTGEE